MSYYNIQSLITVLDGVTLTASYDDSNSIISCGGFDKITVYVQYTPAEASAELVIQIETGADATDLMPLTAFLDSSTGESEAKTHTIAIASAGGGTLVKKRLEVCVADLQMRISAKERFSSNAGTVTITALKNEQA